MKNFIKKLLTYIFLLGLVVFLYILLIYFRPDLVDAFYYRFTTPKARSLVLGASRAGQGLQPAVINKMVLRNENKIINHAFAIGASSYGPNYLKEVIKKLDTTSTQGLFILSVTPGNLSVEKENVTDDTTQFFEVQRKLFVGNLNSSCTNPNLDYLVKHWVNKFEPFARLFKYTINYKGISVLHADGWLEVTTNMDSSANNERIRRSTEENRNNKLVLSKNRLTYLEKIIRYLSHYGDVFLVRMPVSKQMSELENDHFPVFDSIIEEIANKNDVAYINCISLSGQFLTIDTHHLYKKDGERFTHILCDSIIHRINRKPDNFKIDIKSGELSMY
jgi:hypothetical protein